MEYSPLLGYVSVVKEIFFNKFLNKLLNKLGAVDLLWLKNRQYGIC